MANLCKLFSSILLFVGSFSYGMGPPLPDQDAMDVADTVRRIDMMQLENQNQPPRVQMFLQFSGEIFQLSAGLRGHTLADENQARQRLRAIIMELQIIRQQAIDSVTAQRNCSHLISTAQQALAQDAGGLAAIPPLDLFP